MISFENFKNLRWFFFIFNLTLYNLLHVLDSDMIQPCAKYDSWYNENKVEAPAKGNEIRALKNKIRRHFPLCLIVCANLLFFSRKKNYVFVSHSHSFALHIDEFCILVRIEGMQHFTLLIKLVTLLFLTSENAKYF